MSTGLCSECGQRLDPGQPHYLSGISRLHVTCHEERERRWRGTMRSEVAHRLWAALRRQPGRLLCVRCLTGETGLSLHEVRKAVRELVLEVAIVAGRDRCSSCQQPQPVVRLRERHRKSA
jgi:hypothetical protein